MAVDYDSGNGLFDKLGKLVHVVAVIDTFEGTTVPIEYDEFEDMLGDEDKAYLGDLITLKNSWLSTLPTWKSSLIAYVTNLLNTELVVPEGLGAEMSLTEALEFLRFCLGRDQHGVLRSNDAAGTTYLHSVATGNANEIEGDAGAENEEVGADVLATCQGILRNVVDPPAGVIETLKADTHPAAQFSEHMRDDDYVLECTADRDTGGAAAGETLTLHGTQPSPDGVYDYDWQPAGVVGALQVSSSNYNTQVSNGGFENLTGDTFTNWVFETGVWATHWFQDVSFYRGDQTLRIKCPAASPDPLWISQVITGLQERRKYLVAFMIKRGAVQHAGTTVEVRLEGLLAGDRWGQGYGTDPQHASEKFSIAHDAAGLTAVYQRKWFWINTPDNMPETVQLKIELTGGGDATVPEVYIDEIVIVDPYVTADGIYLAALAGSTDMTKWDKWTFDAVNTHTGLFQKFFGRFFNYPMPSLETGDANLIADALAG